MLQYGALRPYFRTKAAEWALPALQPMLPVACLRGSRLEPFTEQYHDAMIQIQYRISTSTVLEVRGLSVPLAVLRLLQVVYSLAANNLLYGTTCIHYSHGTTDSE